MASIYQSNRQVCKHFQEAKQPLLKVRAAQKGRMKTSSEVFAGTLHQSFKPQMTLTHLGPEPKRSDQI